MCRNDNNALPMNNSGATNIILWTSLCRVFVCVPRILGELLPQSATNLFLTYTKLLVTILTTTATYNRPRNILSCPNDTNSQSLNVIILLSIRSLKLSLLLSLHSLLFFLDFSFSSL